MEPWDVTVIGGGILGTSFAYWLAHRYEGRIAVLEKESQVAQHTSRRNTGVVHRPFYLDPVERKVFARSSQVAYGMWKEYAARRGLPWAPVSTFEVATREDAVPRLDKYLQWGLANGMGEDELEVLTPAEVRRHEPNVRCHGAIWSKTDTGVDYPVFTEAMRDEAEQAGARFLLRAEVDSIDIAGDALEIRLAELRADSHALPDQLRRRQLDRHRAHARRRTGVHGPALPRGVLGNRPGVALALGPQHLHGAEAPGAPVPGPALDRPRRRPARDRAERRAGPGAVHVPGVDRHSEGGRRETLRAALPEQAAGGREPGLRHARFGGVGVIHLEARHGRSGSRVPPGPEGGIPYATRYGGRARASDRPPRDVREGGDRDRGAALVPHHELQFARRDRRSRICGVDREPPRSERRARPSQAEAGEGHGPRGLRRDLRRDRRDHAGTEQGHGGRLSGPPRLTLNKVNWRRELIFAPGPCAVT